jgi:hypothetical protein
MTDLYQDFTISVYESGVWSYKWAACLVAHTDLDPADEHILHTLTGRGDTPLEAAADLLNRAVAEAAKQKAVQP